MRSWIWLFLTAPMSLSVSAGQVIHTEVYPKPARQGQAVHFRVEIGDEVDTAFPQQVQILISGQPISVRFIDSRRITSWTQ